MSLDLVEVLTDMEEAFAVDIGPEAGSDGTVGAMITSIAKRRPDLDRSEIRERVIAILRDRLGWGGPITEQTHVIHDLGAG